MSRASPPHCLRDCVFRDLCTLEVETFIFSSESSTWSNIFAPFCLFSNFSWIHFHCWIWQMSYTLTNIPQKTIFSRGVVTYAKVHIYQKDLNPLKLYGSSEWLQSITLVESDYSFFLCSAFSRRVTLWLYIQFNVVHSIDF